MSKLLLLYFFFLPGLLLAQKALAPTKVIDTASKKDLVDLGRTLFHLNTKIDTTKKKGKSFYFSILPFSTPPGGGAALFTTTTGGFYLGDRNTTYLSTVSFAPYFNFHGRIGLPLRSSLWLKDNSWNIQGDTRVLIYPEDTWGLGGAEPEDNKLIVYLKYIRFYQSALKRITSYFFAGLGYNMDAYLDIETNNPEGVKKFTGYPYGTAASMNSFSSGLTANLLYDSRNNVFNPLPGAYSTIIYRYNAHALGSDANWQSIYIDMRKYVALTASNEQNIIAFWTFYWQTFGNGIPYFNLPSIGWDPYQRSGRGIEQNRYRGKSLLYFESEYRRDITRNGLLGFVVFGNVNSASELATGNFSYWHPAAGGGLRIKYNKGSNTNIAIDYGFSKGYSALIVALGEAF
jgi:hypothetical protein